VTGDAPGPADAAPRRAVVPLYAAGFVTAFGAHGIAANQGLYTHHEHASLLTLGVLLALYDGAEVVLNPVFGALTDQIGPRPVLLGGLLAFAVFSAAFVVAGNPALIGVARVGQGAAAAASSPAAGTLLARLAPANRRGRAFGGYGAYKSVGYAAGPLIGGALVTLGGFTALFATLARPRRHGRPLGGGRGPGGRAVAPRPADHPGSGPAPVQPRFPPPDVMPGRDHRRAGGRGRIPTGPRRRRRSDPTLHGRFPRGRGEFPDELSGVHRCRAEKLTAWLAENVCDTERRPERIREQLLGHLCVERIEPPAPTRVARVIGSARVSDQRVPAAPRLVGRQ
jgi:hypothetical protein